MKALAVLVLAALAFLGGCASPVEGSAPEVDVSAIAPSSPPVVLSHAWRVVIDPNVPASRVEVVRSALAAWATAFPCGASFDVVYGPTGRIRSQDGPPYGTIEVRMDDELPEAGDTGYGLWWDHGGSRVAFLPGASDEDFPRVAIHELGHALHLAHDDVEPSVMANAAFRYPTIQPADVRAVGTIWCHADS